MDYGKLTPVLVIAVILLLALFLRSYYVYGIAADNGWLMSGGSDSYYYHRLIEYGATTGDHLHIDPMLNFPDGARNPRPPLYTFSAAVPAVIFQPLFGNLDDSIGFFFITSTAMWGALTIIPVYLIAREIFGRRTGYLAALFLAIMPSDVERSVATLCDHDPFALFFIVLTVYFLMKALKAADTSNWVENWRSPKSITGGLKMLVSNNRKSVLYAMLAGLSFSAIAMAWVGFTYLEVILLASFLIEILINKFKGIDSTTHTVIYFVMFGFGFLLAFPVYQQMNLENMNVPVYLFLAAFVVGVLFSITRDLPWVVVMPLLAAVLGIALAIVTVVYPALGEAIFSGQGYFSASKLYETIAEAKAPIFSQLALSFGMVTFYLSLVGLVLMLWKIPKRLSGDYIIITVWMAIAIFMATSAGRFVFNASPAMALSCAWITVLIIDKLNFRKAGKLMVGSSGSPLQRIRKSMKIRHVIGALFLVFMLIAPNVWFSLDAAMPMEVKSVEDKQVYNSFPDFMRPEQYTNNQMWYFGSFGYNLPMPENYFPAFWSWFSQRDADILPQQNRPAYVSWWDYGFESIDAGDHPAVADNFQQGYQIGGNILLAHSEDVAIGMMIARMLLNSMYQSEIPQEIRDMLTKYGASPTEIKDVALNSSKYKEIILDNPDIYDPATQDISAINIIWRYLGVYFANLTLENEVNLYKELRNYLGKSIGYISVDSRLLPKAASDVGIFYAPCKLTDRTIDEDGNPSDYFVIKAVDSDGNYFSLSDVSKLKDVTITNYELLYSWRFYKTMFYRAYAGFSPLDAGKEDNDGIPGLSGSTSQIAPLPGWNLTHFMLVYRTCYYNPDKNGTGEWRAISLEQGIEYNDKIKAGEMDGLVDLSPVNAYQAGVVTLRYYDGAILTGRITTPEGYPAPGIHVTVQDEWGVPHQAVYSDANGIYTLIMPPGNDLVTLSTGLPDTRTLISQRTLDSFAVNISEDAAMRKDVDLNGDGLLDWQIIHNVEVPAGTFTGNVFWDLDGDGNYTDGDVLIEDSTVTAYSAYLGVSVPVNATTGQFKVNMTTGTYRLDTVVNGVAKKGESTFLITSSAETDRQIARIPCKINGTVRYEDGTLAKGAEVEIAAEGGNGYPSYATITTDSNGVYNIRPVLPGGYLLRAGGGDGYLVSFEQMVEVNSAVTEMTVDFMIKESGTLDIEVLGTDGKPFSNAHVRIASAFSPTESMMIIVDENGQGSVNVPAGTYSLIVREPTDSGIVVGGASASALVFETTHVQIALKQGVLVLGRVLNATRQTESKQATITFQDGLIAYPTAADLQGYFVTYLPTGDYDAIFTDNAEGLFTEKISVPTSGNLDIMLQLNTTLSGQVWHDRNGNGTMESNEFVSFADIAVELPNGVDIRTKTDFGGRFVIAVPRYTDMTVSVEALGYVNSGGIAVTSVLADTSKSIALDLAPVLMEGTLTLDGFPLRDVQIEFFNNTSYLKVTSNSNGEFNGSIYPGDYSVKITSPVTPGGPAYYYYDKMLRIYIGTNAYGLQLEAEKRLKVEGAIQGVPADRSVILYFNGPTQKTLDVFGSYETYLSPGSYVIYAYDEVQKQMANVSRYYLSSTSTNATISLKTGYEVSGEPLIGQREGNRTLLRITDLASGIVINKTLQPGNPYSAVLPEGEYDFYFDMRYYEEKLTSERFYKMVNESTVSLHYRTYLYPTMTVQLDNSSLNMHIVDSIGNPISTEIIFLEDDIRSMYESYTSDANGIVDSTIHPGPYNVYITDSVTGGSYFGQITVRHDEPVNLNIILAAGCRLTVFATVQSGVDIGSPVLTITNLDNGAVLKNSESYGTNSITTLLPAGNYSVKADSNKEENGRIVQYSKTTQIWITSDIALNMALDRKDSYDFEVSWDSSQKVAASIGDTVEYSIDITNTGNTKDSYRFTGSGEGLSFSFPSDRIQLDFGSVGNTATVPVIITLKEGINVEHSDIYIYVTSSGNSSVRRSAVIEIEVLPSYNVSGSVGTGNNMNGTLFYTEISVVNNGNAEDNYTLTILNAGDLLSNGWEVGINGIGELTTRTSNIIPGLSEVTNLTMRATRSVPNGNVTVAIIAVSNHSAASTIIYASPTLPDMHLKKSIPITGDGLFTNDIFAERDVENLVLLAVMFVLLASIFVVRKIKFGRFFR